jgi:putative ABC transport system permease protein
MNSRWKKVWADLWSNKSRTFLTILTIAVGVIAVGFNSNLKLYMIESMDGDFLSASPAEATIYAGPLDDDMVKIASEMPGVEAVEGSRSTNGTVLHTDGQEVSIQFTAVEDPNNKVIKQLKPVLGEMSLPALGEKEIIVDASAQTLGYQPGDTILVELSNGKRRELTLAGYIHDVTGIPYGFTRTMNAYVTPKTFEWLGGSQYYDALAISVAEKQTDREHVNKIAQAVADRMERAGATVSFIDASQPGHHYAYTVTQGIFSILSILGYLTVLLSGFLIVNTVTAVITQQRRHIAIMKAIGGENSQVFMMYVVLILSFGLGALALAIPLANLAAKAFGGLMAQWLNFYPAPYTGYGSTVVQEAIVALLVPLLAALWPVYSSVRVTVREAITDYGIGGNVKPKEKAVSKRALFLPRPMRLSLRNAFRKRARLTLTLFTLVLGGAIFIGVYNLWDSFDKTIEEVQGYFLADVNMRFERGYRFEEVAAIAESIPGVTSVEGWAEVSGTLISDKDEAGKQIQFVAPPSTSTLIDPVMISGRWLMTGDENAIVIGNDMLKLYPDVQIGDWLTIKIKDKEMQWQIIGMYKIIGNGEIPLLYANYEYLSRLTGEPGQAYSVRVLTEQHDRATQTRIRDQLMALYEAQGIGVSLSRLGVEFVDDTKSQTDVLVYFMLGMAVMIAIVGGLGLMGTMSINVLERTREIGVMRAIGASNVDIQGIVIVEGMLIGLISWAVSILLSIPITVVLCFGVGTAIFTSPLPAVYGMSGIIAWLTFTVILATIASSLPARRASRLTVRDTLAYE